jgi:hypothetical protein
VARLRPRWYHYPKSNYSFGRVSQRCEDAAVFHGHCRATKIEIGEKGFEGLVEPEAAALGPNGYGYVDAEAYDELMRLESKVGKALVRM